MAVHNVAIVGLGRVGSAFLGKVLSRGDLLVVKAVSELYDTEGRRMAQEKGVPVMDFSGLVSLGVGLDIIFDLTGDENVTQSLRRKLEKAGNTYTKVAQNRLARLVWDLMGEEGVMPDLGMKKSQAYADMMISESKETDPGVKA
ncbi:hypothetical protein [Maridesulfovibrio sp.]|uniref:hypothetical protein n=1 Tax=Maridesulfovibrio sp. TaxID=2795000 RepID=UPI002A18C0F8|nr:hypothetical protein [Maridesulfovibrio sp.]